MQAARSALRCGAGLPRQLPLSLSAHLMLSPAHGVGSRAMCGSATMRRQHGAAQDCT